MYNQDKFIEILKKCQENISLNEFARISEVDAGYLSRIINKKKKNPPSPGILKKLADASKGITSYEELMQICGYVSKSKLSNSLVSSNNYVPIPIFQNLPDIEEYEDLLQEYHDEHILLSSFHHTYFLIPLLDDRHNYFAYKLSDESMFPLAGIDDIVIALKTENYDNGKIYLFSLDSETIFVRKIVQKDTEIELQAINPYFPTIKLRKEDIQAKKFNIIGKILKSENTSAFK